MVQGSQGLDDGAASPLGAGLVVPWCCVAPAMFSLLGVTGFSFGILTRIEATWFPYLAILAVVLLGRAHYLLYIKHQGNRVSPVVTWASTALVSLMLIIQMWAGTS